MINWYNLHGFISRASFMAGCLALINEEVIFAGIWFMLSEILRLTQRYNK
jgi:hypothetical protein